MRTACHEYVVGLVGCNDVIAYCDCVPPKRATATAYVAFAHACACDVVDERTCVQYEDVERCVHVVALAGWAAPNKIDAARMMAAMNLFIPRSYYRRERDAHHSRYSSTPNIASVSE